MKQKSRVLFTLFFTIACIALIFYVSNSKMILKYLYPLKYKEVVNKYSIEYKVDPMLVFAVMKVESSFDRFALSSKGAKGLMQITDKTGEWAASEIGIKDFTSSNLYSPEINIRIGCWYLNSLNKEFNNDTFLVITAYNSGSGRVKEWLKNGKFKGDKQTLEEIPYDETERYVGKVLKEYQIFRSIYNK